MKGIMKMFCPKCGVTWTVNTNKKCCSLCGAELVVPQKTAVAKKKPDTKKCKSCGYRFVRDGRTYLACQYILVEGHRRPCAAVGCTAYRYSKVPFEAKGDLC